MNDALSYIARFLGGSLLGSVALFGLSGCASTNPRPAFLDMRQKIAARSGLTPEWPRTAEQTEVTRQVVHDLLAEPIDVDTAVRIALLNNRALLASFEELGISQADLAQASRIRNPALHFTSAEVGLSLDFLDVFILPLKKKFASVELERTKLRVADEVIRLAAEVKTAFYELLASQELLERLELMGEIRLAASEFAALQEQAGNLNELDLEQHSAVYNQIRVDIVKAELGLRRRREALNRYMGLWGEEIHWLAEKGLPSLPDTDPQVELFEAVALEQRFDIAAARKGIDQVARALALTKGTRFFPMGIEIGIDSEKDIDGARVTGPSLEIQIPFFDQGQAAIARLESQLLQSQRRLENLSIHARSEVRLARDFMIASRELTEYYRDRLIPQRQQIVQLTLEQYNMMLQGTYDLLAAREREVETERAYIEAWRDYWIARVELERALGGRLGPSTPQTSSRLFSTDEKKEVLP